MRRIATLALFAAVFVLGSPPAAVGEDDADGSATRPRWPHPALEDHLLAHPEPERLRALHDRFCERPHPAGTKQDQWMIGRLAETLRAAGLEVETQEIHPYLPHFVDARLELVEGDASTALPVREQDEGEPDFDTYYAEVQPGWNAYSGSGTVEAEVVYANHGTKADFEQLAALGVSCEGKIVVARYGGNYRGFKAKFAEAAGAAGLIMYTDPADSGWGRGLSWPEGGWAGPSSIQRGSIKTLAYPGDPLTPFRPATKDAKRLDPETVALPKIPVQCVGWVAAEPILSRMRGAGVPQAWQGGLPFRYRLTQGDAPFRVRMTVEQERRVTETKNVLGVIRGAVWPDELVVVGCHFDAWTFGAGDPHAGTIVLFALAEAFADAARAGMRPARTIVFANWAAEEMGIIGSTEWCEAHADALSENAVAYLNLDMAAMGTRFRASTDPLLARLLETVARRVPAAGGEGTVLESRAGADGRLPVGTLGGGSDHVGFYLHLGVPCFAIGASGADGVSYHSAHDHLRWYRRVVGDDYAGAVMLTQFAGLAVAELANAPLHPFTIEDVGAGFDAHLTDLRARARSIDLALDDNPGDDRVGRLRRQAWHLDGPSAHVIRDLHDLARAERLDADQLLAANRLLRRLSRAWLSDDGLPGRPWYRNLYVSTDPDSGYAAWALPELRGAIEDRDARAAQLALIHLGERLSEIESLLVRLEVIRDAARSAR